MNALLVPVFFHVLVLLDDPSEPPAPEDVKAGWVAFGVFIALGLAVAFLGWSLVRQLRKAQAAKDAGVYDEETSSGSSDAGPAA
ncbi:MAG TPA: hypothetical protein VGJ41_05240 [Nocardioides sp.]|jgi:hypothetical protein